jgi:hypothetical protein
VSVASIRSARGVSKRVVWCEEEGRAEECFSPLCQKHVYFRQRVQKSHRNTHKERPVLFEITVDVSIAVFSDAFPSLYSLGTTNLKHNTQEGNSVFSHLLRINIVV